MVSIKAYNFLDQEHSVRFVVLFSLFIMIAEMVIGRLSHSMALIADAIHMATHVGIIGLNWLAYLVVRYLQKKYPGVYDGTRILLLFAFISGILLLILAGVILAEGLGLLHGNHHIEIVEGTHDHNYQYAIGVAIVGLITNVICVSVLSKSKAKSDSNFKAAYLHLLADVLTKIGTILAIFASMLWGIKWIDTIVALVSALVVARWALLLLAQTSKQLTQKQG